MRKKFINPGASLLAVMFLIVSISSCSDKKNDEELQKEISEKLSTPGQNNQNYTNVTAAVKDGVVNLSGQCEGENCVENVASEVKQVSGVKEVENNVQQGQPETDLTLRTSVQSIISKYQGVQADVAGGIIVLRGSIQRDQVQPLMNELSSLNAKKIDNQLAIQ